MPGENPFAGYTGHEMLDYITYFPYRFIPETPDDYSGWLTCKDGTKLYVASEPLGVRGYDETFTLGETVEIVEYGNLFPGIPDEEGTNFYQKGQFRAFFHVDPQIVAAFIEEHGGEDESFVLPDHVTN